jgi:DNA-binding transcriptional ArsR family regulator
MIDYAEVFSALGDPTRLEMLLTIIRQGEVACTTFDEMFPIGKSTISYHVRVLRNAKLITVRKDGRFYYYQLRRDVFDEHLPGLLHTLTQGPAEAKVPAASRPAGE